MKDVLQLDRTPRSTCGALGIVAVHFQGKLGLETFGKWEDQHGWFADTLSIDGKEGHTLLFRWMSAWQKGTMPPVTGTSTDIGPGVDLLQGNAVECLLSSPGLSDPTGVFLTFDNYEVAILPMPYWLVSIVIDKNNSERVAA